MNLSIFPQGIDTFVEHYDIQPADLPNIRRYQELKQKSYLGVEEQNELSNLTLVLREKIFLADDFNKLQDCITNLETFFRDETQQHLENYKNDIKNTADQTLQEIVKVGEDYINTSKHWYTSWVTLANQRNFNILDGSEPITSDVELNFQEEILDLFLNGDMLLPERDYTFVLADNGKKQVIQLSTEISSTLLAGQRMVAKWFQNVGKLYIDHSHEHKTGGKDALLVDMDMLSEEIRLAIGDTTQIDGVIQELGQVRQDLTTKAEKVHKHTKADITDFPTSLPANGGNADTVDGKHATDFASSTHNHSGTYAPVSHSHGDYSPTSHTHNNYAPTSHTHNYAPNNGLASTADAEAGSNDAKYMTPLKVKQAIAKLGMTGLTWGRITTGGTTLSGSGNTESTLTARTIEGSAVASQTSTGFKVKEAGRYLIIGEFKKVKKVSGGASGMNLNFHLGGMNVGYFLSDSAITGSDIGFSMSVQNITTSELLDVYVSASPVSSGQSYSVSFSGVQYIIIKVG